MTIDTPSEIWQQRRQQHFKSRPDDPRGAY
ncbi:uncharacterized protein METZ01_LOCUS213985, partial [marine metagenome]